MAIALGRPRPGHSVLGRGTFAAAEPAWLALAARYALAEGASAVSCASLLVCVRSYVRVLTVFAWACERVRACVCGFVRLCGLSPRVMPCA